MSGIQECPKDSGQEGLRDEPRFRQPIIEHNSVSDNANAHFGDVYHNNIQYLSPVPQQSRIRRWLETFTASVTAFWFANNTNDFAMKLLKHTYLRLTRFGNACGHRAGETIRACYDSMKVVMILTLTQMGNLALWYFAVHDGSLSRDAMQTSALKTGLTCQFVYKPPTCGFRPWVREPIRDQYYDGDLSSNLYYNLNPSLKSWLVYQYFPTLANQSHDAATLETLWYGASVLEGLNDKSRKDDGQALLVEHETHILYTRHQSHSAESYQWIGDGLVPDDRL